MKKVMTLVLVFGGLCGGGFLLWRMRGPVLPSPSRQSPPLKSSDGKPEIKYPVALPPDHEDALKLEESDRDLRNRAEGLFGKGAFKGVIQFESFIRHFVVAVDNATGGRIPAALSPIKTAPGEFAVLASDNKFILSPKNYKRYRRYIKLAQMADLKKIVVWYRRAYPLFQAAYQDLGSQGYFNDKLIEAIDNALETPVVQEPIYLRRESGHYEFEDPDLEALSAIQKIMLRMGPDNSTLLKSKLKDLRQMLSQ